MELLYNETESGLTTTAKYDGNISAMKWKAVGATSGAADQKSYAYSYDKTGRLMEAGYTKKESSWNKEIGAQNEVMTYDLNGNIKTLERKQRKHQLTGITASYTNETIDNLTYAYTSGNKNSLEKVTDAASTSAASGFDNGSSSTSNDYTYDANGNLLSDTNKGITSIVYNFMGKPTQVNFSDGKKIEYVYDAAGMKLTQKLYNGATLVTTTEYVNGFVYEKAGPSGATTLSFFGSPEGRVVNNSGTLSYEYSIADHQGNTRVVFTSATLAPVIPETNFESSSSTEFIGYNNRSSLSEMNHSASGTYSQLLHGGYNSQVGAATSLHVYPGDTLKAEVYAKYRLATSTSSNLTGFAAALTNAFGVNSGSTGEASNLYTGLNGYGALLAAAGRANDDDAAPKGFITIMLFDKHYNLLDASWDQMGDVAQTSTPPAKDPFDRLFKKMVVTEEGYAYIFVSNENPTKVDIHFDDLKVTHVKSNVIQYNEYYPFGLQTSSSWTREATKDNQFLYNAASELNKTNGWYEMYYRGYDPAIGRMLQVDPYATMYASQTTYNYAVNNPVMINDPNGGQAMEWQPGMSQTGVRRYNMINVPGYAMSEWSQDFAEYAAQAGGGTHYSDYASISALITQWKNGDAVFFQFDRHGKVDNVQYMDLEWEYIGEDVYAGLGTQNGWFLDKEGKQLFDHWLEGSGKNLSFLNGSWGDYMKKDGKLFLKMYDGLAKDAKTRTKSDNFSITMHAETERNDYKTGYGLLHGTLSFSMHIRATVHDETIDYSVVASWYDEINPNRKYVNDRIYSEILKTFADPKDYFIRITWYDEFNGFKR